MTFPLPGSLIDKVHDLTLACLSGEAGHEDVECLDELLQSNEMARHIYAHAILDSFRLRRWAAATRLHNTGEIFDGGESDTVFLPSPITDADLIVAIPSSSISRVEPLDAAPGATSPVPGFLSTTLHGTIGYFSQEIPFSLLIATVVTGLALWIGSLIHVSRPEQIEQIAKNLLPPARSVVVEPAMEMVGRITGMVDCKWVQSPESRVQSLALDSRLSTLVSLGDKFALASGLVEITYDTGAKVILQGPCNYEVESGIGGFLSLGKLTARVESMNPQADNPKSQIQNPKSLSTIHYPLFTINTPTATVTDLGTEFGVEVSKEGHTTSYVFRGSVKLQVAAVNGGAEAAARVLHENESARVEKQSGNQGGANRVTMLGPSAKPSVFVREIGKPTITTFDLVDVVASGDGFSGRRNATGIDPSNGRIPDQPIPPGDKPYHGDGKYHRVEALPFVDGVFIPDGAAGAVQIDSAGHLFEGFPRSECAAYGYISVGGVVPTSSQSPMPTTLDGIDYSLPGHGLLWMHANKGITFDLEAIRRANPGHKLLRFRAVAGNTGGGEANSADIWVFVDGSVRFQRRQVGSSQGAFSVAVPLSDKDRFLTLTATDAENGLGGDFVMFGDPRLELLPAITTIEKGGATTSK